MCYTGTLQTAGWRRPEARWAHVPQVAGSTPAPAYRKHTSRQRVFRLFSPDKTSRRATAQTARDDLRARRNRRPDQPATATVVGQAVLICQMWADMPQEAKMPATKYVTNLAGLTGDGLTPRKHDHAASRYHSAKQCSHCATSHNERQAFSSADGAKAAAMSVVAARG